MKFFEISTEMYFVFLFFLNKRNITTWRCFRFLIYVYFNEAFVKNLMKKLSFFNTKFQNSFQDVVYYRVLGFQTLWYQNGGLLNIRQNLKKRPLLFRSEISIFDICFKRMYEESFEDLQINSNWKSQTCGTMSHKISVL